MKANSKQIKAVLDELTQCQAMIALLPELTTTQKELIEEAIIKKLLNTLYPETRKGNHDFDPQDFISKLKYFLEDKVLEFKKQKHD